MFDDHDRDRAAQFFDEGNRLGGLGRAHSGGGLVQEQELRLRRKREADLETALFAVRQAVSTERRAIGEADLRNRALDESFEAVDPPDRPEDVELERA